MNQNPITVKRALISVSDKTGLVEFARGLQQLNIDIISTGGTSHTLRQAGIETQDVADVTGFPEMMDGRVKTLHPLIHGGILGQRDQHAKSAEEQGIRWIDLVVVNLYPFTATIRKPNVSFDEAVENIDIGGPTLLRSAGKNMGWVGVIVDPADYEEVLTELQTEQSLGFHTRHWLATKAFGHVANYDTAIHAYLLGNSGSDHKNLPDFPDQFNLHLEKKMDLRYGENPHQRAAAYCYNDGGILSAEQRQGKELSYNNISDADAAVSCLREFSDPTCVVVKHSTPCGVATATDISDALSRAFNADKTSAFGGVVALNRPCDKQIAEALWQVFIELVIAPAFTPEALSLLATKPNLRVLELDLLSRNTAKQELKFIESGLLIQDKDLSVLEKKDFTVVTKRQPSDKEIKAMLFAWQVVKHVKSNAILLATTDTTVGIGAGQVSRVDAVEIALRKAGKDLSGLVMASDAFFPFRDSIDRIANTGIHAVIQPGGSIKDADVIAACNEYDIAMVFTGKRCFKH
jgi:phosphoribosylaminoimidazolecarboxamide formyltransferase/IMP cyclohydrolase